MMSYGNETCTFQQKTTGLYLIPLGAEMGFVELEEWRPWIPQEKWERIERFLHWQDRQRTVLGYSLANYMLANAGGLARKEIKLSFDYYGKPHFPDPSLFFNLSHSGGWIACGVNSVPIGVDVEQIQEIDLKIAESFFAPIEVQDLFALPEEVRRDYFFTLWTLKESYIKAIGKGVSIPLDSFWFRVSADGEISFGSKDDQRDWKFCLYDFDTDYKLAVCVLKEPLPKKVEMVSRNLIK